MWKLAALSALALLAAVGATAGAATARTPFSTQLREAGLSPAATGQVRISDLRKRKIRGVSRHRLRGHAGTFKCFAHEWRAFPTRDRDGYFFTPPGGGVC